MFRRGFICLDLSQRIPHKSFAAVELVEWSRRFLTNPAASSEFMEAALPETLKELVEEHWGDMRTFLRSHPRHFTVDTDKMQIARAQLTSKPQITVDALAKILTTVVPPAGFLRVSYLSSYLHDVPEAEILRLVESSDTLSTQYSVLRNKNDHVVYLAHKAWYDVVHGSFSVGDNRSVAQCIYLAPYIHRAIPSYWIALESMEQLGIPAEARAWYDFLGPTKALMVLPRGSVEYAEVGKRGERYLRRAPGYGGGCGVVYPQDVLDPWMIIKLAFCLPTAAVPFNALQRELFPSVRHWLLNVTRHKLEDLVRMYPSVLMMRHVGGAPGFCSKVRHLHPMLFARSGTGFEEDEREFMSRLSHPSNTELVKNLLKEVREPSSEVFVPVPHFDRATLHSRAPKMTDDELVALFRQWVCESAGRTTQLFMVIDRARLLDSETASKFWGGVQQHGTLAKFFWSHSDVFACREVEVANAERPSFYIRLAEDVPPDAPTVPREIANDAGARKVMMGN